jgi:hypothetical protein
MLRQAQHEGKTEHTNLILSLSKDEARRHAGCLMLRQAQHGGRTEQSNLILSLSKDEAPRRNATYETDGNGKP